MATKRIACKTQIREYQEATRDSNDLKSRHQDCRNFLGIVVVSLQCVSKEFSHKLSRSQNKGMKNGSLQNAQKISHGAVRFRSGVFALRDGNFRLPEKSYRCIQFPCTLSALMFLYHGLKHKKIVSPAPTKFLFSPCFSSPILHCWLIS